jgi:hypothetical protein
MRQFVCPIGLECVKDRGCPNRNYCLNLTHAWDIPYTFEVKDSVPILTVKWKAYRQRWTVEATCNGGDRMKQPYCPLPSGQYLSIDGGWEENEVQNQIAEEWKACGWIAAIDLNLREFHINK